MELTDVLRWNQLINCDMINPAEILTHTRIIWRMEHLITIKHDTKKAVVHSASESNLPNENLGILDLILTTAFVDN